MSAICLKGKMSNQVNVQWDSKTRIASIDPFRMEWSEERTSA